MNIKQKIYNLFLSILVVLALLICPVTWTYTMFTKPKEPVVKEMANGYITDKNISHIYGGKSSSGYNEYFFIINGKLHNVNKETYFTNKIGDKVVLTIKDDHKIRKAETILFFTFFITIFEIAFVIMVISPVLYKKFKEWLEK